MSFATSTFTPGFAIDLSKRFWEVSLAKTEYIASIILAFPKITRTYRFILAFDNQKFSTAGEATATGTSFICSPTHTKNSILTIYDNGTGTAFASATSQYIEFAATDSSDNRCEIFYKNLTSAQTRFLCNTIRLYIASSSQTSPFCISEIKPVIQVLADDIQGQTMELGQNLTIRTNNTGSDVLQIDASGLYAWSGSSSAVNYLKLEATGLKQYCNQNTGSSTSEIVIGYLGTSSGSDVYGAWFPQLSIGGTSFDNAPIMTDSSGNITVTTTNSTVDGGLFTMKNGSGTVSFQCAPNENVFLVTGDVKCDTSYFTSNMRFYSNGLTEYATNGTAAVWINFHGYQGGTTQFRDFVIYNGKSQGIAYFQGSDKSTLLSGPLTTSGTISPGGSGVYDLGASASYWAYGYIGALRSGSLINPYTADDAGTIAVNQSGYQDGTTYFRDFHVYNGKGSSTFFIDGSSKTIYTYGYSYLTSATVSGSVEMLGTLAVSGATVCSSTLVVKGAFTASSTAALQGVTTVSGALTASSTLVVKGTFTASSTAAFQGAITSNGLLTILNPNAFQSEGEVIRLNRLEDGARYNSIYTKSDLSGNAYLSFLIHNGTDSNQTRVMTLYGSGAVSIPGALTVSSTLTMTAGVNNQLVMSDYRTTQSHARFGSLEIQGYAINNSWVGDNIYYVSVGNGWTYRNNGYGNLFYMYNGYFHFDTFPSGLAGASATRTERMRITNAGLVGIGTSTPATTLHVAGSATISGANSLWLLDEVAVAMRTTSASSNGLNINTNSTGDVVLTTRNTSNAERLRILGASGYVGIGTSTPTCLMHLAGNNVAYRGQLSIASTDYSQITFYYGSTTTTNLATAIYRDTSSVNGGLSIVNQGTGDMNFATNNTTRAYITGTGHFYPYANNTYTLGGASNRWSTIYGVAGSLSTLDVSGGSHASASLTVNPGATYTYGVYSSGTVTGGAAIYAINNNGYGAYIRGRSPFYYTLVGHSGAGDAILGYTSGTGTFGVRGSSSGNGSGVIGYASNTSYYGVYGYNGAGNGVYGYTAGTGYAGVIGSSSGNSHGVYGYASNSSYYAVYGYNGAGHGVYGSGSLSGVYGLGSTGHGVYGYTTGAATAGVRGSGSGNGYGVIGYASNTSYYGVYGYNGAGHGVYGRATGTNYAGVYGYTENVSGYSGYFSGGKFYIGLGAATVGNLLVANMPSTSTAGVALHCDASGNVYKYTSSIRYKHTVKDLTFDPVKFYSLRPSSYNDPHVEFGFIAEHTQLYYPEVVLKDLQNRPDAVKYEGVTVLNTLAIHDHEKRLVATVKAVNDHEQQLKDQQAEIDDLKSQLAEIKALLGVSDVKQD